MNFKDRPLSWSAISSFQFSKDQWYKKYILKQEQPESKEMAFGKKVADSFQTKNPLAPVILYPVVEQKLSVVFNYIPLTGYIDTYEPATHNFREFKTGKKAWDQKRANEHGQLAFYALCLYIIHKIPPKKYTIHLDWLPTQENGDFSISFVEPLRIQSFQVKLTMADILNFGTTINKTVKAMEEYVALMGQIS